MIDESLDKEQMNAEPQPWEFRSKPAWQRLIVMLGGIIVNVITGVIAFIILTYNVGETFFPSQYAKEFGFIPGELGKEVGFEPGDKVIAVNGGDFERVTSIWSGATLLTPDAYWTVDRNGQTLDIPVPDGFLNNLEDEEFQLKFLQLRYPFTVGEISPDKDIPLLAQDVIVSIDSIPVNFYDEYELVKNARAGQTVAMEVLRQGERLMLSVPIGTDSIVGFRPDTPIEESKNEYTFSEAVVHGTNKAFGMVVLNAKAMGRMFSGEVNPRSLSGPIGIMKMYPKKWDWNQFWYSTGFISMILAFMNLLPIPALDGGHVVFLLFEMISGRAPSDQFLENAQKVGMIFLLGLMVFVFGNDILKLFGL